MAVTGQDAGAVGPDEAAFDGSLLRSWLNDRRCIRGSMIEGVRSSTIEVAVRRLTIRTVGRWDDRCDGRTVFRWDGETVGGYER